MSAHNYADYVDQYADNVTIIVLLKFDNLISFLFFVVGSIVRRAFVFIFVLFTPRSFYVSNAVMKNGGKNT